MVGLAKTGEIGKNMFLETKPDLVTVDAGDSIETVATVISEQKCHTLPVMENGDLVGVIGKADIVRVIAQGV